MTGNQGKVARIEMDAVLKQVGKKFERKAPDQLKRPSREEAEAAVRTLLA